MVGLNFICIFFRVFLVYDIQCKGRYVSFLGQGGLRPRRGRVIGECEHQKGRTIPICELFKGRITHIFH